MFSRRDLIKFFGAGGFLSIISPPSFSKENIQHKLIVSGLKFSDIVEHLSKRGFATRKSWKGRLVVFYGMDNGFHSSYEENEYIKRGTRQYRPCLADIGANDWIVLPYYWDGSGCDYLPFDKKDKTLESLKEKVGDFPDFYSPIHIPVGWRIPSKKV